MSVNGICENKCLKEVIAKEDIAIITGSATLDFSDGDYLESSYDLAYPEGFNKVNCIVLSVQTGTTNCFDPNSDVSIGAYGDKEDITAAIAGTIPKRIALNKNNIKAYFTNLLTMQQLPINYKIVLMKV